MSTVPDCERGEAGGGHGGRTASEVANARHAFVTAGKLRRHKRWILAQDDFSRAADQALNCSRPQVVHTLFANSRVDRRLFAQPVLTAIALAVLRLIRAKQLHLHLHFRFHPFTQLLYTIALPRTSKASTSVRESQPVLPSLITRTQQHPSIPPLTPDNLHVTRNHSSGQCRRTCTLPYNMIHK